MFVQCCPKPVKKIASPQKGSESPWGCAREIANLVLTGSTWNTLHFIFFKFYVLTY